MLTPDDASLFYVPEKNGAEHSEVQRQLLRGWWLPGRADCRQGHALRAPDSELTASVPDP